MAGNSDGKKRSGRKKRVSDGRILVNVTPEISACLQHLSGMKGLAPTTLARMWIMERLLAEGWSHEKINETYGPVPAAAEEAAAATA
jgi:hypothetical protein